MVDDPVYAEFIRNGGGFTPEARARGVAASVLKIKKQTLEACTGDYQRKRVLIEKHGHVCWKCKNTTWNEVPIPLELNHIDGDPDHNDESNLEILCPNCHAQTDTYRGKNRGRVLSSSRKTIMQRYGSYR